MQNHQKLSIKIFKNYIYFMIMLYLYKNFYKIFLQPLIEFNEFLCRCTWIIQLDLNTRQISISFSIRYKHILENNLGSCNGKCFHYIEFISLRITKKIIEKSKWTQCKTPKAFSKLKNDEIFTKMFNLLL